MSSNNHKIESALVAGAGIGGLTVAIALARSGVNVNLIERASTTQDTGAGIQLGPNALHVLDALNVLDPIAQTAFEPRRAVIRRFDTGTPLMVSTLNPNHEERYGQKYLHVHRADLMNALVNTAKQSGVTLHSDVAATFEQNDHEVHLACDNASYTADVLIGADGIHSNTSKLLGHNRPAQFTGQAAWRALIPTNALPKDLISPDANVWAGPNKHLVAYYVRRGELVNVVAVREQSEWAEESWKTHGDVGELKSAFSHWDKRVVTLLDSCKQCYFWGLFDRQHLPHWYSGRVALLGDACHPMLPFMAQGAAMAIEDAWVLSAKLMSQSGTLEQKLASYQSMRLARTNAVKSLSDNNARLYHASSTFSVAMRNAKLSIASAIPAARNSVLDKVYGYDVTKLVPAKLSSLPENPPS